MVTQIFRVFVGGLFIFSGLVKLNDPMGMAFKLHDYFAPDVLNLTFLNPLALSLAVVIVIVEVVLGAALLLGYKTKWTLGLLLAMILFFTFLTFYSAWFDKVTDCGCFGDAIPLTPWQSFGKDILLLVLILWLLRFQSHIRPLFTSRTGAGVMVGVLLINIGIAYYVLRHLPFIDFRPYAIGNSIPEGMKSAEELGLEPPKYLTYYVMVNKETGEEKEVDSDTYVSDRWWEKEEWEIDGDQTKSKKVRDGYEAPIHDFVLELDGEDVTDAVLSSEHIVLVISYDLEKSNASHYSRINTFVESAEKAMVPVLGITATDAAKVETLRHEWQMAYPFASADQTTLKTIVRANPGVVVLKNGVVVDKWNPRDLPEGYFSSFK